MRVDTRLAARFALDLESCRRTDVLNLQLADRNVAIEAYCCARVGVRQDSLGILNRWL
jgi:hypothetical protein